eukprot:13285674-Alexandrium_andersonii.AAC.1
MLQLWASWRGRWIRASGSIAARGGSGRTGMCGRLRSKRVGRDGGAQSAPPSARDMLRKRMRMPASSLLKLPRVTA